MVRQRSTISSCSLKSTSRGPSRPGTGSSIMSLGIVRRYYSMDPESYLPSTEALLYFHRKRVITNWDIRAGETCCICLEPYDGSHRAVRISMRGCMHTFGQICLYTWLASDNESSNTCPICRQRWYNRSSDTASDSNTSARNILASIVRRWDDFRRAAQRRTTRVRNTPQPVETIPQPIESTLDLNQRLPITPPHIRETREYEFSADFPLMWGNASSRREFLGGLVDGW
ncbi:hypothetical protein CC86DRAFT_377688 [Ophiobolus disseminans]|uniref:RING-type domain-containing protein n=1 Tax=Ophiobolus disseminans TaxID=1469910 RepID=A0A6A7AHV7_9PLEO|nr:hypothetical protein CC86DRAFT_377688 [Ophiobolus disseminans]